MPPSPRSRLSSYLPPSSAFSTGVSGMIGAPIPALQSGGCARRGEQDTFAPDKVTMPRSSFALSALLVLFGASSARAQPAPPAVPPPPPPEAPSQAQPLPVPPQPFPQPFPGGPPQPPPISAPPSWSPPAWPP